MESLNLIQRNIGLLLLQFFCTTFRACGSYLNEQFLIEYAAISRLGLYAVIAMSGGANYDHLVLEEVSLTQFVPFAFCKILWDLMHLHFIT